MFGFVRKKQLREALAETLLVMKQQNTLVTETTKLVHEAIEAHGQAMAAVTQSDTLLNRAMANAATWQRLYDELTQEKAQQAAELACIENYPVLGGWVN